MRIIFPLLFLLIFDLGLSAKSKDEDRITTRVDTISTSNDSLFVRISDIKNDTLFSEITAFLFPDSIQVPRFRFLGNLFTKTIYVDRIVRHGSSTDYSLDGKKKVEQYHFGRLINTIYFDNNNVVSKEHYDMDRNLRGPCGDIIGEFLIHGSKKPSN